MGDLGTHAIVPTTDARAVIDEKARVEAKDANMELGKIPILSFTRKTESKRPHICWTIFKIWTYYMKSRKKYAFMFKGLVKSKNI